MGNVAILRDGTRLLPIGLEGARVIDASSASIEAELAALEADVLVLDVEPERTGEWTERALPLRIPLLLRDPLGGSPEEHAALRARLAEAAVPAMALRRFSFSNGPLKAASVLDSGRIGGATRIRLARAAGLPSSQQANFQAASDDKARYDLLFEDLADLLGAARKLGADLTSARLASPLSDLYWRSLAVAFDGGHEGVLHANKIDEEVEVTASQGSFRWRCRGDRERIELTENGAMKSAPAAPLRYPEAVASFLLDFVGRQIPLYEDVADQELVFETTSRLLDDYLYGRALELKNASRDAAISALRTTSKLHERLTPYSYQDWTVAFKADLDVCQEIMRPLNAPFSVLLVRVPFPIRTDTVPPPLGIAQIAGVAQAAGAEVTLVDLAPALPLLPGESWTDAHIDRLVSTLRAKIGERKFDLAGFSLDDLTMWPVIERLAREIARTSARHVVLGGRPAGRVDRQAIVRSEAVDFVIEGEGELGLMQLVRHLSEGASLDDVSGLWARSWPLERLANVPIFPVFEANPPPVFDGLDLSAYTTRKAKLRSPYLSYLFILGCPYKCAFCGNESAQRPRHRPAGGVVRDLRFLRDRYDVRDFYFLNNMINTSDEVLVELVDAMEVADLGVRWVDCGRPANLSREMLARMAGVGCVELTWGIDTGSQRLHNLMRKGYRIDRAMQVLRDAYEVGIDNTVNLIIGMPHETEEDFQETLKFVREHHSIIRSFAVHPYFYAYKSPVRNAPTKFGLRRKGNTYDEIGGVSWREHLRKRDDWVSRLRDEIDRLNGGRAPATCV